MKPKTKPPATPEPPPQHAGIAVHCAHARMVDVVELIPNPRNPNKHGDKQVAMLAKIIRHQGWRAPITVSKRSGFIVTGHGRLEAAKLLQVQTVPVDFQDFATEADEWAHLVADNRIAELADIDGGELSGLLKELEAAGMDLDLAGFDTEALGEVEGFDAPESDVDAEPQTDKAEELREKWDVKAGQLWELGNHRILCGDSTKADDVKRVMRGELAEMVVTDPPYGVAYTGGTTKRKALEGDETPDLYEPSLKLAAANSTDDAPCYLWHSDSKSAEVSAAVSAAGYERRSTIIWNKNMAQFGALGAQYKTKHEPCYYLFKKGNAPNWSGPTNEVTVWDIDRNRVNENHPTEKPIECMARPMRNHSATVIYEPFSGSGTTIIACEQLGRKCRAIEISPAYVAVALQRWADATGKTPKLIDG